MSWRGLFKDRREQIASGFLIDVSKTAGELGFDMPVGLTREAWKECVQSSNAEEEKANLLCVLEAYLEESDGEIPVILHFKAFWDLWTEFVLIGLLHHCDDCQGPVLTIEINHDYVRRDCDNRD